MYDACLNNERPTNNSLAQVSNSTHTTLQCQNKYQSTNPQSNPPLEDPAQPGEIFGKKVVVVVVEVVVVVVLYQTVSSQLSVG